MGLLLIFLKPALLLGRLLTSNSLTLNFDGLGLVSLQITGKTGLFGGWRGLGSSEFLNMGFSLTGFGGLGLVGAEFAEVEVLDGVGCCFSCMLDQKVLSTGALSGRRSQGELSSSDIKVLAASIEG